MLVCGNVAAALQRLAVRDPLLGKSRGSFEAVVTHIDVQVGMDRCALCRSQNDHRNGYHTSPFLEFPQLANDVFP